jgi:hypothetical protein
VAEEDSREVSLLRTRAILVKDCLEPSGDDGWKDALEAYEVQANDLGWTNAYHIDGAGVGSGN